MKRWMVNRARSLQMFTLVALGAIAALFLNPVSPGTTEPVLYPSQYSTTITAPFNQPDYYPFTTSAPSTAYRPVGAWVGRLILPSGEQYQSVARQFQETDWAWLEVQVAPAEHQALIGKRVRLGWLREPLTERYVQMASRDVRMAPEVQETLKQGVIHPTRLNGRDRVGPLQSLAGAHPFDDVTVVLQGAVQVEPGAEPMLRTNREPMQETGQYVALVKLLEPVAPVPPLALPSQCPGEPPCSSDVFRVQHYNPATQTFDGPQETIHIPQQPQDWEQIYNMTTRDLHQSPVGEAGWYIYGAMGRSGLFTVQAMKPRSLVQLNPQQVILGFNEGLRYIHGQNWQRVRERKGTLQTVLLDRTATTPDAAQADWQVGDRFLSMHIYGGRGGIQPKAEAYVLGNYPGHFSFGAGEVIRDEFTGEPVLDYHYYQVYGNGSDGTLSGGNTWANYMGNLQRGKMGVRPVSDVLIKLNTLTDDYAFGDTRLSFFNELIGELNLIAARYRIGDGSGDSTITSATSCVQDSAQAIFLTLRRFQQKVESNPQAVEWMRQNPQHPSTRRFQTLVRLAKDLGEELTPMGVVRWDWAENADVLTGVRSERQFISIDDFRPKNLLTGLVSWRTALPRLAHDDLAMIFLRNDAKLWFLRPNQIGGNDPTIFPLEPTLPLGAWKLPFTNIPLFSYPIIRSFGSLSLPTAAHWRTTLVIILALAAIALPIGFSQGFLRWQPWNAPWYCYGAMALWLLIVPALMEEWLFRVLPVPYPRRWNPEVPWWLMAIAALVLFVLSHPFFAQFWGRARQITFSNPTFLLLTTLLGLACTIDYRLNGSLWTITVIHWLVVALWLLVLGGMERLYPQKPR